MGKIKEIVLCRPEGVVRTGEFAFSDEKIYIVKKGEHLMRTPSKEFMGCLENSAAYQYILHTKKPDFSKLSDMCKDFEKSILEAQEIDRKKIAEALKK